MSGQAAIFLVMAVAGGVLGVLYDCFRILRRVLQHKTAITTIEDAIFWIASTLLMFTFLLDANFGDVRGYMLMGMALGAVLYFLVLSRYFTKFATMVLQWIKRLIVVIISPVMLVYAALKNKLKSGQKYVRMKRQKLYQHMKRRQHERQAGAD